MYKTRFIKDEHVTEMVNLWHLSKVPTAGSNNSRYDRLIWTAKEFHKKHPEVSRVAAYKDLEGIIAP